ncbi:MAG: cupin-like domain-containing protein [Bdellovibrionales bacterium]|nr:cupin-like domain-containing protein [Bdellovibrionales bacterium]
MIGIPEYSKEIFTEEDFLRHYEEQTPFVIRKAIDWTKDPGFLPENLLATLGQQNAQEGGVWFELGMDSPFSKQHPWPDWMRSLFTHSSIAMRPRPIRVWIQKGGTRTPMHYDSHFLQGLNLTVVGRKHWIMAPPQDAIPAAPFTSVSTINSWTREDLSNRGIPSAEVVVESGDFIFVPQHWWHQVETTDDSVNYNLVWTDRRLIESKNPVTQREKELVVLKWALVQRLARIPGFRDHPKLSAMRSHLLQFGCLQEGEAIRIFSSKMGRRRIVARFSNDLLSFRHLTRMVRSIQDIRRESKVPRNPYDYFQRAGKMGLRGDEGNQLIDRSKRHQIRSIR